jgi:multicomponent Na+:H+ antiporter subunit D
MQAAMILFAALCILIGVAPDPLYGLLPYPVEYVPYTGAHVVTQLQLLLFSGLAFFVMLDYLRRTLTITLDADWFYRIALPALCGTVLRWLTSAGNFTAGVLDRGRSAALRIYRDRRLDAVLSRTGPTGGMALWLMVMLLAYLLLYQP